MFQRPDDKSVAEVQAKFAGNMFLAVPGQKSEHADEGEHAGHAAVVQVELALMQATDGVPRSIGEVEVADQLGAATAFVTGQVLHDVDAFLIDTHERVRTSAEGWQRLERRTWTRRCDDHNARGIFAFHAVQIRDCLAQDGRLLGRASEPPYALIKGRQRVFRQFFGSGAIRPACSASQSRTSRQ
jgi:hypothetical protein